MPPSSPPPYNPYAPPAAPAASLEALPAASRYRPALTTWIYLGLASLLAVVEGLLFFNRELGLSYDVVYAAGVIAKPLLFVPPFVGIVWIYQTWSVVDDAPRGAVGRFFIPVYNFYWTFACQQHICSSIDDALAEVEQPGRAPRDLAALAPALYVVTAILGFTPVKKYVLLIGPVERMVWFAYMFLCDRAMVRVLAARGRGGARGSTVT
jgi:hypothetical protein